MEVFQIGLHGHHVRSHVTEEPEEEIEHAVNPFHNTEEHYVMEFTLKERFVASDFAQVKICNWFIDQ